MGAICNCFSVEGWGGIFLRWQVGIAGKHGWLEGIS